MSSNQSQNDSFFSKITNYVSLISSGILLFLAYQIFIGNIPRSLWSYYSYFYILLFLGIIGLVGEKAVVTLLSFALPLALGVLTIVLKVMPEQYPVEDWWDFYSILVFVSVGFLIFLFWRYESLKRKTVDISLNIKGRADPILVSEYKKNKRLQKEELDSAFNKALSGVGSQKSLASDKKNTEAKAEEIAFDTIEERLEHEMKTLKDDFTKRSVKLTTTLLRMKMLAKSLDKDEIFENILAIVSRGVEAIKIQLLVNDDKKRCLKVVKSLGGDFKEYEDLTIPYAEQSMISYLVSKHSVESIGGAKAFGIKECELDPKTKNLVGKGKIKSVIVAPIYLESKLFALVNVEKMINPDYTKEDANLIATCADIAGLVMKNARLYSATVEDLLSTKRVSEAQLKQNEELKGSLSRIVSPGVADIIMSDPSALKLGGRKAEVTVFFSDIRGFTAMSEGMDPNDIVELLNEYFSKMTDILMEMSGTLDKYVGDELMALFGAPVARDDDPVRAVLCAVKMIEALRLLQKKWLKEGKPSFSVGIGINTGLVTAGWMGSEKQLSFTVIGDDVNLAARVMSIAKGMEILITRNTYEEVHEFFEIEQRESVMLKGKSAPVEIFCVKGVREDLDTEPFTNNSEQSSNEKPTFDDNSEAQTLPSDTEPQQVDEQRSKVVCSNCGTHNNMQEKFCTKCGMPNV